MTIIAVVAGCVAVFAVLLLVLFLTGVITTGSQVEVQGNDTMPSVHEPTPYEIMESLGTFRVDNATRFDSDLTETTLYEWKSNDGAAEITKHYSYPVGYPENPIVFYMYWNCDNSFSVIIDNLEEADDQEKYIFLSWCDKIGITPEEIMEALDQYSESVK